MNFEKPISRKTFEALISVYIDLTLSRKDCGVIRLQCRSNKDQMMCSRNQIKAD